MFGEKGSSQRASLRGKARTKADREGCAASRRDAAVLPGLRARQRRYGVEAGLTGPPGDGGSEHSRTGDSTMAMRKRGRKSAKQAGRKSAAKKGGARKGAKRGAK